jgi:hypothetical protein
MSIMRGVRSVCAIVAATIAFDVGGVTARAQLLNDRPPLGLARTSLGVVGEYRETDSAPIEHVALPSNLTSPPVYRRVLESMMRASPTFRRQCQRIANDPRVSVQLQLAPSRWTVQARAVTRITRHRGGRLTAIVEIVPLENHVELIAHEFEHVIEQLDEIDLAAKALLGGSGVRLYSAQGTVFETTRATQVGLRVAKEFHKATGRRL